MSPDAPEFVPLRSLPKERREAIEAAARSIRHWPKECLVYRVPLPKAETAPTPFYGDDAGAINNSLEIVEFEVRTLTREIGSLYRCLVARPNTIVGEDRLR